MAELDSLLRQLPIDDIATQLGVDRETAHDAVQQALPGLVSGMRANAQDEAGARSLRGALDTHRSRMPSSIHDVDREDGGRIVENVFGDRQHDVAAKLAERSPKSSVTGDLMQKVLPIIAPFVLAWIAKQVTGGKGDAAAAPSGSGGGLGDLLGRLLGGGGSGGGIGDLLGGLLGGGRR